MFLVKSKSGSDEVAVCPPLAVTLIQAGAVRLTKARWPVELRTDEGRVAYVRLSDVESLVPVQSLTGCRCDEHGTSCP